MMMMMRMRMTTMINNVQPSPMLLQTVAKSSGVRGLVGMMMTMMRMTMMMKMWMREADNGDDDDEDDDEDITLVNIMLKKLQRTTKRLPPNVIALAESTICEKYSVNNYTYVIFA